MALLVLASMLAAAEPGALPRIETTTQTGERFQLAGRRGHPVVVTFWATWCAVCKDEMAALDRIASRMGDRAGFLAVAVDAQGWKTVLPFLRQHGYRLPVALMNPGIRSAFGLPAELSALPQTMFFDRNGRLAVRFEGGLSEEEVSRLLKRLAAGGVSGTVEHP